MTEAEELLVALTAAKEREDAEAVKDLKYKLFFARQAEREELAKSGKRNMIMIEDYTEGEV